MSLWIFNMMPYASFALMFSSSLLQVHEGRSKHDESRFRHDEVEFSFVLVSITKCYIHLLLLREYYEVL